LRDSASCDILNRCEMRNNVGVQTVDRALQLLLAFDAEADELGVTELAVRLSVHKSTASRLAATLEARGFLERSERDTFRLGPALARLGLLAGGDRDLVPLSRGAMERLAEATGETVNLAVLDGDEAVNIAQVEGPHIVGVGSWTGRRTPLHCTANGKALLAFSDGAVPDRLESFTKGTITSREVLLAELEGVREDGYALAVGELELGLHAVAAPVLDADGCCVAALSVSGPSYRVPERRLRALADSCRTAADEIAILLERGARAA
jgi:DNA-binding IclR family transcriptional regulator